VAVKLKKNEALSGYLPCVKDSSGVDLGFIEKGLSWTGTKLSFM